MTNQVRAGTSGYSYREWRGAFYPPELPQDEWLSFYASKLPAVEINNTFYRMPRRHVVETWRDSVPPSFRFVLKASRRITHQSRLKNAAEATAYLVERAALLDDRLGAVLFQLPPNMRCDLERLQRFQDLLPADLPAAFEFRHDSWRDPMVDEALARRSHARVITHDGGSAVRSLPDGPMVYLRLRAPDYSGKELARWRRVVDDSSAEQAYVFFKHEDAGGGAGMAAEFLALGEARARKPAVRAGRKSAGGPEAGHQPAASATADAPSVSDRAPPKRAAAKRRAGRSRRKT